MDFGAIGQFGLCDGGSGRRGRAFALFFRRAAGRRINRLTAERLTRLKDAAMDRAADDGSSKQASKQASHQSIRQ
jgi:hypothetical protein